MTALFLDRLVEHMREHGEAMRLQAVALATGPTGPTGLCHESTASIDEAARWLATLPAHERPSPIVSALRDRFGLSPLEACQAIREAGLIRARAM